MTIPPDDLQTKSQAQAQAQALTQALAVLANGIIPADERDAGAAAVNAGSRLADRMRAGINAALYADGLRRARELAPEMFESALVDLAPADLHALLDRLRVEAPGFFKQLRMDVAALYLGDPGVWRRIGFPGPAIETGGYPDFDQPQ
jgi:hypothetical protein